MRKRTTKRVPPLTDMDVKTRSKYLTASHTQGGNLHERMKWLVGCKESLRKYIDGTKDPELFVLVQALGFAVLDLETELAFHEPASPPFTRRDPTGRQWPATEHRCNPTPKEELAIKQEPRKATKTKEHRRQ